MDETKREKLSRYWTPQEPSPLANREIRDVVEERIQAAMAEGKFKNLPGKGKPLKLDWEHPWEEQDWMANHLLSNAHVVPEWVVMDKEIKEAVQWLRSHPDRPERAVRIDALNKIIDRYNLAVPAGWMQKARYRD